MNAVNLVVQYTQHPQGGARRLIQSESEHVTAKYYSGGIN